MSEIKKLIDRLCPDGVEYKAFYSVCSYQRGITYSKRDEINDGEEGINVLRANNIDLKTNTIYLKDIKVVSSYVKVKDKQWLKKGDILICAGSGSKEHIGKVAYIFTDTNYTFGGFMGVVRPLGNNVNSRYLFHILTSELFKRYLIKATGAISSTINNINNETWVDFEIPVPPLEVQSKIVEILDNFTELEEKLEAELEARRKQYEYYRNQLLSFEKSGQNNVKWMTLGEIAYYPKERIDSTLLTIENYIGVENLLKDRQGKTNATTIPQGMAIKYIYNDILIGNIRPYLKKIWKADRVGGTNGDVICVRIKDGEEIDATFLYYVLSSDIFFDYDNSHSRGGKMPRGDKRAILNYKIPLPPLSEQEHIVSILDRFEALTTDLQSGLPAEIEARRKQYEYYREQLLTFKRKTA